MPRIFKRGQLHAEAEQYAEFLISFDAGGLTDADIDAVNRDLAAKFGREGLSRIKAKAWRLREARA
jgi:hypothetical protein